MKVIRVFTTFGINKINTFIKENDLQQSDIINVETVIEVENVSMRYVKTTKKKTFKLWYWGPEENKDEEWNWYEAFREKYWNPSC